MATAEELMRAATLAKRATERELRMEFHRRWGKFLKCDRCGGRPPRNREHIFQKYDACPCSGTYREAGYSWTGP